MKKICSILSVLLIGFTAQSQTINSSSYKTALGVKVWDGVGISFKTFTRPNRAIEAVGFFWNEGFRLTGLYEIHGDISGAPGLKWYIGPGAHIGFYNQEHNNGVTTFGLDGVIGLDYKINGAPINISLDWQPAFEFANDIGFQGSWGGLGIRYTF
jgi:hypothetical protein